MKRSEAILVGALLVGCVAAIAFIFTMMTEGGGAFQVEEAEATARTEVRGREPAPRVEQDSQPEPATPLPEPAPDPAPEAGPEKPAPEAEEPEQVETRAELVLVLLTPSVESERRVAVTVTDQAGVILTGVMVVVRERGQLLFRDRTDSAGLVVFDPYPEERGPFRIDALEHGYEVATSEAVAAGAEIDLVLTARASIGGRVKAPSEGHGLVTLLTEHGEKKARIKSDGTFLFEDLDEGYVTVQAEVPPYGVASNTFLLKAGTHQELKLRVRARDHLRIYGRLHKWPGAGRVTINGIGVPVTKAGGYEFGKAVIGINEIFVDAPERALMKERFTVRGLSKSSYNFTIRKEGIIEGRVRNGRTKNPVADAVVRLGLDYSNALNENAPLFPIERVAVVRTDQKGRYEIRQLDARLVYLLSVVREGHGQYLAEALPTGVDNVILPEGPFLYGKLRGLGGVPRDAVVTARPLLGTRPNLPHPTRGEWGSVRFNVPAWNQSQSLRDNRGYYGLTGLLPGAYIVRVDAPGYGSLETVIDLGHDRRRIDLRLRKGQFDDSSEAELLERLPPVANDGDEDLPPPADVTLLHLDLRQAADKEPFPGVRVTFYEDDEEFSAPMEFDDVEAEILGLPEATYRAILTHPSLKVPKVVDEIVLRRGEVADVKLFREDE